MSLQTASEKLKDLTMVMQESNTLNQLKQGLSEEDKEKYKVEIESAEQMIKACIGELKK